MASETKIIGRCKFLKPWSDWDDSIHSDEAQISRQGRAMTYPFDFKINKKQKQGTFSSTSDLPFYTTTLTSCNCYDFQGRKLPCKHIYRLAVELGLIEIISRGYDRARVEEIKNSDDVDSMPEQIKRIEKAKEAKCAPQSIDYENGTGVFKGSGKKPYEVTEKTCTCRDYFVRKLPCKHIYRLRMELEKADNK